MAAETNYTWNGGGGEVRRYNGILGIRNFEEYYD